MKKLLTSLETLLEKIGTTLQPVLLLAIRLYWGWQCFLSGKGKLMGLDKVTAFFTDLHIPAPRLNAIMAGSVECFGGLLLLLGVYSRFVSIPLMFTMVIAYITADKEAVQAIFSEPDKFVTAAPFLFLYAFVIIFVFGPGKLSFDGLVRKKA